MMRRGWGRATGTPPRRRGCTCHGKQDQGGVIGASVLGCVMGDIVIDDILIDEHPLFPHSPMQPLCNHCGVGLSPCKRQGSTESHNRGKGRAWEVCVRVCACHSPSPAELVEEDDELEVSACARCVCV